MSSQSQNQFEKSEAKKRKRLKDYYRAMDVGNAILENHNGAPNPMNENSMVKWQLNRRWPDIFNKDGSRVQPTSEIEMKRFHRA